MTTELSLDELRGQAKDSLKDLRDLCTDTDVEKAKSLIEPLRNARQYDLMGPLAEAVSRYDHEDAKTRRLYAQYLIETGYITAAIDVLQALSRRLADGHPERLEASGLLGRAHKQIFLESSDKTSVAARRALKDAIVAYRKPYESDPDNTWHGVNLVALLTRARRLGIRVAADLQPTDLANRIIAALQAIPSKRRDEWYWPTLAEALLGVRDWNAVEKAIRTYAAGPATKAFLVNSTLRQFTEVWDLEAVDDRGRDIVAILRARLLQLPGGELRLAPQELQSLRSRSPAKPQLEAILGKDGPQTYRSMQLGLERALSVASIRQKLGGRVGTGFLVRAGNLGLSPEEELLVLTNWHVINQDGAYPGIQPQAAEIVFEAVDPNRVYHVKDIVWCSPVAQHDTSLLRLDAAVTGIKPLPFAGALPVVEKMARVYVIGYPGGRDLSLSLQDNKLLDHEGPKKGKPQIPGVWRLHYRAPTEPGSSGSPVFNTSLWEVIALHHAGGKLSSKLNGKKGTYASNEGIAIKSIRQAIRG